MNGEFLDRSKETTIREMNGPEFSSPRFWMYTTTAKKQVFSKLSPMNKN